MALLIYLEVQVTLWLLTSLGNPVDLENVLDKTLRMLEDRAVVENVVHDADSLSYKFSTKKCDVEVITPNTVRIISKRFLEGMEFTLDDEWLSPKAKDLIRSICEKVEALAAENSLK